MKKVLSIALSLGLSGLPAAAAPAPPQQQQPQQQPAAQAAPPQTQPQVALSNKDVLDMVQAGLTAEVVVAKIKSSATSFDTSPATLQGLKTAGVPDPVILAMVQAPAGGGTASAPPAAAPFTVSEAKLLDGTAVEIELNETISSDNLKEGSIVDFTVVQPVVVGGVTVIEKGAPAKARITRAKKAGYWGRSGKLEWAMQDAVAADGSRVPMRFEGGKKGSGSTGKVATGVVVTAVVFFPAAPLWGFKKGKNAVISAGQRYQVAVHGDAVVKGKVFEAAGN